MELLTIHKCLCDATRLRILNLLRGGPLCVCHIQEILGEPQVKVSRHLNYLKKRGLAAVRREANWMIYSLPQKRSRELAASLACLQACAGADKLLRRDTAKLAKVRARLLKEYSSAAIICCAKDARKTKQDNP
jgi:ArsR family transcriptional regulator